MPNVSRRGLIGGAIAVGALSAACDPAPTPNPGPSIVVSLPPFDPKDWASVRAQFAYDPAIANMATFVFASSPATVRAAIARHQAQFDFNPIEYLHANEVRNNNAVKDAAAEYLGGTAHEVMLTDSTTMGLGLLYNGIRLSPGDEILTTEHDFYATYESLRWRTARDGATVRRVRLYEDPAKASVDEIVSNLAAAIRPNTKVIALTWVHSSTGVTLPVKEITRMVAGRALVCLDSVHGFGAELSNAADLGVDFLVSGTHKWLFGPRGTGLIWGKTVAWQQYLPVIPTFDFQARGNSASPGGYKSFEYQWSVAEAFAFHKSIGRDRITARIKELAAKLKDGLAGIKGITLHTPRAAELSAGIICCSVEGMQPTTAKNLLYTKGVLASVTPYNPAYLRFGTSMVNTEADVERTLKEVRALV
ncbi:aminotransferase class V-fold PLP-dependent enzyme [Catelliglobosispora koreensis]|uniref:aminotransferase class V-fold PLP-dependent enzyme n=1 Tax=Catelliglobosispora koreensis TaxID=129052 RepID=UPI00036637B3|nr:aminotransferase class V-fold PLP-dependent enzyme [Catelliglobosispora koreensis]